ncbi:hypothetical protein [Streptomyces niveus]
MTNQPSHNPRTCTLCTALRHPSNHRTRRALLAFPRQWAPARPEGEGDRV